MLLALLVAVATCSQLPKLAEVAEAPKAPAPAPGLKVREAVEPCAAAMNRASQTVLRLVAAEELGADARPAIDQLKAACTSAFSQLSSGQAPGPLRDTCMQAAYARESVADAALGVLGGNRSPIALATLQYKYEDQLESGRACDQALAKRG